MESGTGFGWVDGNKKKKLEGKGQPVGQTKKKKITLSSILEKENHIFDPKQQHSSRVNKHNRL
jgi:predicted transcriptional regulator